MVYSSFENKYFGREGRLTGARRFAVGLLCASFALSSCVRETDDHPVVDFERAAPHSNQYYLDTQDPYYTRLEETLETATDPTARENIEKLLETPISQWLNGSSEKTARIISENLAHSGPNESVPVFVAYNIPYRDLGGESGGGMATVDEYEAWIDIISETVNDSPAVLILEPDALAGVPMLDDVDVRNQRLSMLRNAMMVFRRSNANMAVYLDIGHSKWLTAGAAVNIMNEIDPERQIIQGISVNISNQRPENELREYINEVSLKWGRQLYAMVDNSMNGAANTAEILEWCNPADERIGVLDDIQFDAARQVEQMYIKAPGESDGRCGTSDAPAGVFDSALLLKQVSSDN